MLMHFDRQEKNIQASHNDATCGVLSQTEVSRVPIMQQLDVRWVMPDKAPKQLTRRRSRILINFGVRRVHFAPFWLQKTEFLEIPG